MFGRFYGSRHACGGWAMASGEGGSRFGGRGGGGPFGRHRGGPFGGRGPRMFDPGALRLVVLGLIAEQPRHGYDIIKALETRFQGAYSPSPGAIYPMLQMMEEADLVVSQADGNKRLYSITDQGRTYLKENAEDLARINAQIDEVAQGEDISLGEEVREVAKSVYMRLRRGQFTREQARKARDILKRARRDIEDL
ncbi:PadR family transcriptional regulator [Pseudaminobacter sp. 19-2017]|uniref:PadR family transcriptional regulator n=1 Tax=Pseudaminobacter soli (ex Zhang et al. 2022) TaxID=2831468 RepID=A0A942I304_9HYPH|nr:PadR family transcriptional regulator [Pseudaminobacter soli]MBS3649578.1 PadR family transcriptional regulator [Pseudaminobacter soli]